MRRRLAAVFCALVSAGTLMAMAAPAAAAPLQDFYLASNNGVRVAVAQGLVVNGTGTFVPNGPNHETLLLPAGPVDMQQTPLTHTEVVNPSTCRATVLESGTFQFSYTGPDLTTFGGTGPYTLTGFRTGRRVGTGCVFTSPELTQYSLTAHATALVAVPPPPPPPPA